MSNATSDGNYLITQLPAGHYRITAEKEGFKTWSRPDVDLSIGDRYRADARLEVGQITQTVEVQARMRNFRRIPPRSPAWSMNVRSRICP